MSGAADRLARLLEAAPRRLADISEEEASRRPGPDRWSLKEILGHMIDSAGNNHQRFVRAQLAPRLEFPEYQQEFWVKVQAYGAEPWPDLVNLWLLFNRHLLHVIRAIPNSNLSHICVIGDHAAIPLAAVIDGYLDHVEHHMESIIGTGNGAT